MKKLLLIPSLLILTLVAHAQMQGVWSEQNTNFGAASTGVRDIIALDSNVAWMISYDGTGTGLFRSDYSRTIDGGATWTAGNVPVDSFTYDWASLTALNRDTAWAMFFNSINDHGGQIWKTTNGGTSWTQQGANIYTSITDGFPNNIYFWNANDGVICGDPGANGEYEIYTSSDGGSTWNPVDTANIPNPQDADEAAWTTHFQVIGDTVWFDTNEGRVYRSTDKGHTWQVGHSTLAIVPGNSLAIDICFTSGFNGIARLYDDGALTNTVVNTTDGGLNWDTLNYSGDLYGGDIARIPGANIMISTGISNSSTGSGYTGTSYSADGGATWITIENGTQRGALGIADSTALWCGGFTDPAVFGFGGAYKMKYYPVVSCTDGSLTAGTQTSDVTYICDGDSVLFTVTGGVGPESGYYSGLGWAISSADISGSQDPLNDPSTFASQSIYLPASSNNIQKFINDGALIGNTVSYGTYYWTPVFFGNAINTSPLTTPATFLGNLTLDPNCTHSGNSIPIIVYAPNDPACINGISEVNNRSVVMNSFMKDQNTLQLNINSVAAGKAAIQVMDITGRIVLTLNTTVTNGSNKQFIDVTTLASGPYIVKANINGNEVAGKIVKY